MARTPFLSKRAAADLFDVCFAVEEVRDRSAPLGLQVGVVGKPLQGLLYE